MVQISDFSRMLNHSNAPGVMQKMEGVLVETTIFHAGLATQNFVLSADVLSARRASTLGKVLANAASMASNQTRQGGNTIIAKEAIRGDSHLGLNIFFFFKQKHT